MAWTPISNAVIQYAKDAAGTSASGYYLKFYASGTSTPFSMASASDGSGLLAKCQINSLGYPINGSGDVFIPHVNQDYRIVLYPTSADADANTFANAIFDVDDVNQQVIGDTAAFVKFTDLSVATGGSLIGYKQDELGAIERSVLVLLREISKSVKDFGAVGDGAADDTVAIQAAFATGKPVYFPAGTYLTSSAITLGTGNSINIFGDGRDSTTIRNNTTDVFTVADSAYLYMRDMAVYSGTGGGHCFNTTVNSSQMTFSRMALRNDNAAKSLWNQELGYLGNVTWEQCRFIPNSTDTLTAHPFNLNSTQIFNGWKVKDCRCEKTLGTLAFFNCNTQNVSSYNTNCTFQNITFQEPYSGWFKLGACRAFTIDSCASYDQSAAQTGHSIQIGLSNGGLASQRCKIKHCGRYPSGGGTLGAGIQDILLDSAGAANTVIESCFNSSAGNTFTVDYGNNKVLHIDRPSNSESSYSNAANVTYIDINGNYEGIVAPAYRTTTGTSSRELTISAGSITPSKTYHRVDTEANAASDDLDTVVATNFFEGDILTLRAENAARTVVLKDGTGNLKLAGDFSLDNTEDTIQLLYNGTNWQEVTRSDNGA